MDETIGHAPLFARSGSADEANVFRVNDEQIPMQAASQGFIDDAMTEVKCGQIRIGSEAAHLDPATDRADLGLSTLRFQKAT
jgi:hypothetical protein